MSQYLFENIDPYVDTGVDLAADLNSWKDAVQSCHKGNARPSYAVAGTLWVNDTSSPWKVNVYNGTTDVEIGTMNATTSAFIPTISTPVQFDNSVLPATTAFVQRALGNYAGVVTVTTTPYNLSNTDYGKVLNCGGSASAINLPPSVAGASLSFYTATPLAFNRSGADVIVARPGEGASTSATIPGATAGKLIGISGGWLLEVYGDGPRSLSANGYQKLPSGLIIQWGTLSVTSAAAITGTVTLPVAYLNACLYVSLSPKELNNNTTFGAAPSAGNRPLIGTAFPTSSSGFIYDIRTPDGSSISTSTSLHLNWLSVGY